MTLTKNELFRLTSPKGIFTPDAITEVTSWNGIKRTVYSKNVNNAVLTTGSIEKLEIMVKNYIPVNNDGARFDTSFLD